MEPAMIDLDKTAHHKVYRTELVGDTLVVEPQGDSPGFGVGAVQNEMATVVGLAKSPEVRNLVVDLGRSNYYGSLMLGEIVNLGQSVRARGGRIALAGTSHDMKEILRIMRLDGMWERYPTREMALRALADRIPWKVRIRPYVGPALRMIAALAVLALILWFPRPNPAPYNYRVLSDVWDEAAELRRQGASDAEWELFLVKALPRLAEIAARLKNVYRNEPAKCVLYVARDHGPKALAHHLDPQDPDTIAAEYYLACYQAFVEHRRLPPTPPGVVSAYGSTPPDPGAEPPPGTETAPPISPPLGAPPVPPATPEP
jgi:anti-anti-sigma factor